MGKTGDGVTVVPGQVEGSFGLNLGFCSGVGYVSGLAGLNLLGSYGSTGLTGSVGSVGVGIGGGITTGFVGAGSDGVSLGLGVGFGSGVGVGSVEGVGVGSGVVGVGVGAGGGGVMIGSTDGGGTKACVCNNLCMSSSMLVVVGTTGGVIFGPKGG